MFQWFWMFSTLCCNLLVSIFKFPSKKIKRKTVIILFCNKNSNWVYKEKFVCCLSILWNGYDFQIGKARENLLSSSIPFPSSYFWVILVLSKLKNLRLISFDSKKKRRENCFKWWRVGVESPLFICTFHHSCLRHLCDSMMFHFNIFYRKLLFGLHYYFIVLGKKMKEEKNKLKWNAKWNSVFLFFFVLKL